MTVNYSKMTLEDITQRFALLEGEIRERNAEIAAAKAEVSLEKEEAQHFKICAELAEQERNRQTDTLNHHIRRGNYYQDKYRDLQSRMRDNAKTFLTIVAEHTEEDPYAPKSQTMRTLANALNSSDTPLTLSDAVKLADAHSSETPPAAVVFGRAEYS